MTLSPMRFKDYVWPHNPRVYEIEFSRQVVSHKIPMGKYSLQNLGRSHRVLRGEGEFAGEGRGRVRRRGSLRGIPQAGHGFLRGNSGYTGASHMAGNEGLFRVSGAEAGAYGGFRQLQL